MVQQRFLWDEQSPKPAAEAPSGPATVKVVSRVTPQAKPAEKKTAKKKSAKQKEAPQPIELKQSVLLIVAATEKSIVFKAATDLVRLQATSQAATTLQVIRPDSRETVIEAVRQLPENSKVILVVDVDWGYIEFEPMAQAIAQRLKEAHPVTIVFGLKAKGERLFNELKRNWRTGGFQFCEKTRKPGRKTLVPLGRKLPKQDVWAKIYDCVRPQLAQIIKSVSDEK